MDQIHLELLGKSAKVSLRRLPHLNPEPPIIEKTSLGPVSPLKAINGVNSNIEPQSLTPDALITGDPELILDRAGLVLDPESLSTAFIDPSDKARVPVASFTFHADREERLPVARHLDDDVTADVGGPKVPLSIDAQAVGAREDLVAEALDVGAVGVEFVEGLLAAGQHP